MRKALVIVALVTVPAAGFAGPTDSTVVVRLSSTEPATIVVDGRRVGRTPVDSLVLERGAHIIEALPADPYRWTSTAVVETVLVDGLAPVAIELKVVPERVVRSEPWGARVTVDGVDRGMTPLALRLSEGSRVEIEHPGFAEFRWTVGADTIPPVIVLRPLLNPLEGMNGEVLSGPGPLGLQSEWGTVVSAVAMVASGTAAAYFKDRANRSFEAYKAHRDAASLHDVRTFDKLSGFAMLTTQVSFVALVYTMFSP